MSVLDSISSQHQLKARISPGCSFDIRWRKLDGVELCLTLLKLCGKTVWNSGEPMAQTLMNLEPKSPTDGKILAKKLLTKSQDLFGRAASKE